MTAEVGAAVVGVGLVEPLFSGMFVCLGNIWHHDGCTNRSASNLQLLIMLTIATRLPQGLLEYKA